MARPLRIEYPGAWYHVMNRGGNYKAIYLDDGDKDSFLNLVGETCTIWNTHIHAYCLMDNHYHLLVETPKGGLGRAMRHLNSIYTQRFNRKHGGDGPLFRGRYKAILVNGDDYLLQIVRYIHMNPAKKGNDINAFFDYTWSSNRYYLGKGTKPEWLSISKILNLFSENTKLQRSLYKEFITDKIPEEILKFYAKKRLLPILGDISFVEWAKKAFVKQKAEDYEIPEANKKTSGPTVEHVLNSIVSYYKIEEKVLKYKRRGVWNEPRKVAMYLCRQMCGLPLNEIQNIFSADTYTAVSMSNTIIKKKILTDKGLKRTIDTLKSIINDKNKTTN